MRPQGQLYYVPAPAKEWVFKVTPSLAMRLKRMFPRMVQSQATLLRLKHTPDIAADIEWVLQRYPLTIAAAELEFLNRSADAYRERQALLESIMAAPPPPSSFEMALAPREYQAQAAALYLAQGHLLLADVVGAGKTVSAIASFTDKRVVPVCVVVKAHLTKQWKDEIAKFLPAVRTHIVKKSTPYELPAADVYICTYNKLHGWWGIFAEKCRSVVFDEIQEVRVIGSGKYEAARNLCEVVPFRLGLSATPIHNYGGEAWNVFNLLCPDVLGGGEEFMREWCTHGMVNNPEALGSYLRENKLMLRRTRKEIGRELPPIVRYVQDIEVDHDVYQKGLSGADELARLVLSGTFLERGQAARQFDLELRQATGLAKAPYVAELIRMLVESGEQVLVGGWHRAVYDVWLDRLSNLYPVMFTGSESPTQKEASRQAFIEGRSKVMLMSLRSGSGLNGLQDVCSCCVIGELDWTPAVHEQFIGRLARDGQTESVQVFIPVAPVGCDPTMASVLGLKQAQATGIVDLGKEITADFVETDPQRLKQLAIDYLKARKLPVPEGSAPPGETAA
jgi:SNF2 family DNA or RNA helicase